MNDRKRKKWLKKQGLYVKPKEIWNLDCNIAKYILPRLKAYKKLSTCYPGREEMDTPEKWDVALDKMIRAFEIVIDWDNFEDKYHDCGNLIALAMQRKDEAEEGLNLFGKWFMHLNW